MQTTLPKKIFYALLIIIGILLITNILSYINLYTNGLEKRDWFFRKFNFDSEKNFPTIFSSLLHLTASILLCIIGSSTLKIDKKKKFWYSLSFIFLFIAFDELLRIHESLGRFVSSEIETSGIFHYSWLIPYGILLIILVIVFIKPMLKLPRKTFVNFCIAAAIFISGAAGIEMLTGWYISTYDLVGKGIYRMPSIFVFYTFEELFEMLGVSVFIYELIRFLKTYRISSLTTESHP